MLSIRMEGDRAHETTNHVSTEKELPHLTHVVLSGGGLAGICYIGMFRFLEIEKLLGNVRHIVGSSAGALIATMFALGWNSEKMEENIKNYVCKNTIEISLADVWSVFKKYGIDEGHKFVEFLAESLGKITFLDLLKRTGIQLVICATHVATLRPTFFCADRTPNVCVIDALRASVAIPWFVCPVKIGEDYYIDGSVSANVPVQFFENVDAKNVLMGVIQFGGDDPVEDPMTSPLHYTYAIINRFLVQKVYQDLFEECYPHLLWMNESPIPFMPITATKACIKLHLEEKQIDEGIAYGYVTAYNKFASKLA